MYNDFKIGDYVIYTNKFDVYAIGRVTDVQKDLVFVVCTEGCTSSATPKSNLHKISNQHVILESSLGYHRFDSECPEYDEQACSYYCKDKSQI